MNGKLVSGRHPAYAFQMLKMNRSGAATRARILEAAALVLAEEGVSGFTLQAVAKRADIRYGNLTHHYASRDILVEAMFESIVERYRARFRLLTARAEEGTVSLRDMVAWLLDDSVSDGTAPVFLQLWAMAAHLPSIAHGMARLYDHAVDAFMEAYGVDPHGTHAKGLREALYLLGTVIEGSSAIFWTRDRSGRAFQKNVRELAIDTLVGVLETRLAVAREAEPRAGGDAGN